MAQETVLVPDIGGSDAAEVVEVLVAAGDSVEVDQGLIVLESDKASMEIPSTVAGKVVEVLAKEGDELGEGASVAVIETTGDADDAGDDQATGKSSEESTGGSASSSGSEDDGGDNADKSSSENAEDGSEDSSEDSSEKSSEKSPGESPGESPDSPSSARSAGSTKTSAGTIDVPIPDIGTDEAVDLIEIAVKVGDTVAEGDTLVVLESDKASMEVPSPAAGVVKSLAVQEGQQVREGDALLVLEGSVDSDAEEETNTPEPTASKAPASDKKPEKSATPAQSKPSGDAAAAAPAAAGKASSKVYAGPAVRRLARELGVPLAEVKSSGPRGRILKEDLHQFVQRALTAPEGTAGGAGIPAVPDVDFGAFGPTEVVERSKIDKVTAANMQRSWLNVPHVTQFDDADITELESFRKSLKAEAEQRGTRLTPLPFLLKACAVALKRHEKINSSLSDGGTTLTYKRYVHIGMAVDTPAGLVVPVLRDVDQKSLWELAEEVLDLAGRARDRKLKPAEMQGGGFTISSLGPIGGRGFTPIVNAPEVAILGVSRAETQPVWDGQAFQPRLMMPLGLSYDHRVVNGGDAGRFLTELCQLLGDIRKLLL